MKVKTLITVAIAASLAVGCASTQKYVVIDGNKYEVNHRGEAVIDRKSLAIMKKKGDVVHVEHVGANGALVLTPKEFETLTSDRNLFYSELDGRIDSEVQSNMVREGSLRENLSRIAGDYGFEDFQYNGLDYHVDTPKAIASYSIEGVLDVLLDSYPITYSVMKEINAITFMPKDGV